MLENISDFGKPLTKSEQKTIKGGIWNTQAECEANCNGTCFQGFGGRWACFE